MRSMARWQIFETKPGEHDIARRGRTLALDVGDFEETLKALQKHRRWDPLKDTIIYYPYDGPGRRLRKLK